MLPHGDVVTEERATTDTTHIDRLGTLGAIDHIECQVLSLLEGLVLTVGRLDAAMVNEDIGAFVLPVHDGQESVPVDVVKPFTSADLGADGDCLLLDDDPGIGLGADGVLPIIAGVCLGWCGRCHGEEMWWWWLRLVCRLYTICTEFFL